MALSQFGRKGTMSRFVLEESKLHPAIREHVAQHEAGIVKEVQDAVAANAVVVVGMATNPFPKKACKALDAAGVTYRYLEYGSYFGGWRKRNALKMWTGWPTFPMVFVKGTLVGGFTDLETLITNGELKKLVA
jgi:glutaredoxin-related protein